MRATVLIAPVAGLLALLTACSGDNNAASPPPSSQPADRTTTSESTPGNPGGGTCPVGEYEVNKITGKAGAEVNGVPIVATSGGGLKLALTDDGKWTLTGDGAEVTLKADRFTVEGTVDGTAEGSYTKVGEEYAFRQEGASGKITLTQPVAGTNSLPMSDVGPALAPGGKAKVTCGEGGLTISSESVELQLDRTGASSEPTTPTATGGGAPSGSGDVTVNDSAKTRTIDCAGRNVTVSGSANKLTLTGSCAVLSVNGSKNEIAVEKASEINVNGSLNVINWSTGDPKVANNGTGNKVSKG